MKKQKVSNVTTLRTYKAGEVPDSLIEKASKLDRDSTPFFSYKKAKKLFKNLLLQAKLELLGK